MEGKGAAPLGGGKDRPGEAYADITAFVTTHASCVGRGFRATTCAGYGDTCLTCTGIRDQDWDQHASHTPATPAGFVTDHALGSRRPRPARVRSRPGDLVAARRQALVQVALGFGRHRLQLLASELGWLQRDVVV